MNNTPRTDGEWNRTAHYDRPQFEHNLLDFARQLERELTNIKDQRDVAVWVFEKCREDRTRVVAQRDRLAEALGKAVERQGFSNDELIAAREIIAAMSKTTPIPSCPKCGGKGHYFYDHNHSRPCEQCCTHTDCPITFWWDGKAVFSLSRRGRNRRVLRTNPKARLHMIPIANDDVRETEQPENSESMIAKTCEELLAEKKQMEDEIIMKNVTKCRYADQYKGKREPSCGCFVCETKWRIAELERSNEELMDKLQESINASKYAASCASGALYVANLSR